MKDFYENIQWWGKWMVKIGWFGAIGSLVFFSRNALYEAPKEVLVLLLGICALSSFILVVGKKLQRVTSIEYTKKGERVRVTS